MTKRINAAIKTVTILSLLGLLMIFIMTVHEMMMLKRLEASRIHAIADRR